jgi:hypothetical protein
MGYIWVIYGLMLVYRWVTVKKWLVQSTYRTRVNKNDWGTTAPLRHVDNYRAALPTPPVSTH